MSLRQLAILPLVLIGTCWESQIVAQERPSAPKLLPESTVAYARVANAQEVFKLFKESNFGRVLQHEQIQPLFSDLYGTAVDAFKQVEDEAGFTLDEIRSLPQGEISLALVLPEEGLPALVGIFGLGESVTTAKNLLSAVADGMQRDGWDREPEDVRGTQLNVFRRAGRQNRRLAYCFKDQTLMFTSNVAVAKQILDVWDEEAEKPKLLSGNRRFTTIMKQCVGEKDERPQISWFFDPLTLVKKQLEGNLTGQLVLGIMSEIGVDGLRGLGGSAILGSKDFDMIVHNHLLLANPRTGITRMLAFDEGEMMPEPWVPHDAASYMTMHWNAKKTYKAIRQVWDDVSGEGVFDQRVGEFMAGNELTFNIEDDLIGAIDGRITVLTWMEPPARVNSATSMIGVKLKDPRRFRKTLEKLLDRLPQKPKKSAFAGTSYYLFEIDNRQENEFVRTPEPCFAIVDDYLLFCDSTKLLNRTVNVKRNGGKSLSTELDFKLIGSKIRRQKGGDKPTMISFQRPDLQLQSLYEIARGDALKSQLSNIAETDPFLERLNKIVQDNPLPPFSVVSQFMAPAGALVTDDETGLHYMAFSIRRKQVQVPADSPATDN